MQDVPNDVFQHDIQSFPQEDPKVLEAQAKAILAEEKARKAQDATAKKDQAALNKLLKEANTPVAKKAAPHAEEEVKALRNRELMAHKIRLYFRKLGHKISVKEPKTLPRDEAGLHELLFAIETELQSSGGIEIAGGLFVQTAFTLEKLNQTFNPLGLLLSGPEASLAQTIAQNRDKWDELVTEFAIANAEWLMVGPGKRLLGFIVQTATAVDDANRQALMRRNMAPVPAKEKEENSDL